MKWKEGDFIQVGQEICYVEEFLGDPSTTYIQGDKLYAAISGHLILNKKLRTLSIITKDEQKRIIPRKGDIIIGTITAIRKNSIGVAIGKLNHKLVIGYGIVGNVHISNVSRRFIDNLESVFQKTDIIRATVLKSRGTEWDLSTVEINNGVIYSECKFCGTPLVKRGKDALYCPFCGNEESRLLTPDYGMINELVTI